MFSIKLKLWRQEFILPCPVRMVVKFMVGLSFNIILCSMLGQNDFVFVTFVVVLQSFCHCLIYSSFSSLEIVPLGILL